MANITHLEVISRIIDLKFKWYHTQQTLPCCAALQGAATCPIECHDPKPIAHPFWKFHDDCLKPIYFSVPLQVNKCPYHSSSDSATKVLLFSVVHVCGCKRGNSWTVGDIITKFLLEQEIWSKIAHIWKWLHSNALRCFNIADILTKLQHNLATENNNHAGCCWGAGHFSVTGTLSADIRLCKTFSLSNATWKPVCSNSLSPPVLPQAPSYTNAL